MLAVLAPLIVFGLVIFVHELGHFIAAKLTGVYAPRFSVGFGPALWRKRWGETEYVLAALPGPPGTDRSTPCRCRSGATRSA